MYGSEAAAERLQQHILMCRVLWLVGCPVVMLRPHDTASAFHKQMHHNSQVTRHMSHVAQPPKPC